MQSTSTRWTINWADIWKSVRTMLVVGVASIALYFISQVEPQLVAKIPAKDAFFILPIVTMVTEMIRRWATDHTPSV